MSEKIVSIFITIFMLMMCMLAVLTLNVSNLSSTNELEAHIADSSVISTDGEINTDSEVILRGYDLISSIIGTDIIDSRLDRGDKIYTVDTYSDSIGNLIEEQVYSYMGVITSRFDIIDSVDPLGYYSITYKSNLNQPRAIVVEIKEVNKG